MPLSETNKKQSQSIEDLIAQLDTPSSANEAGALHMNGNNSLSNHSNGSDHNDLKNRKVLKGKRTNSTSFSSPGSNGTTASLFQKANSFGQNSEPILCKNIIMSKKYSKHMKSLRDRGNPKKGGAGGKHTWGAPGCELDDDYIDSKDPNYDSEDENVVMVCVENHDQQQIGKAKHNAIDDDDDDENSNFENLKELNPENLEAEIKLIVLEYFHNGDTIEVIDHLKCYNLNKMKSHLIAYLVQIALEHNNTCKELMSRLLRDLTEELFAEKDFVRGFDLLLKNLADLTLDNPDAPEKVGTFIARAIADKVLPKVYLERCLTNQNNNSILPDLSIDKINKAIESARLLVNINDHLFQLSHIWGNKGGFLAVKELTDKINELIQEYHDSGDMNEAIRCLKDLNVPHFHHEFIFEALDFALQKGNDHAIDLITTLLNNLCKSVIVTYDQLKIGFTRLFDLLPDISLDVPNANSLLDKILNQCQNKGFVSDDIIESAPNRSRKRFVSEGDGGRFKE